MSLDGVLWGVVLALHLLGMAAWVGGMLSALLVVRPALAALEPALRANLHGQTLRRFFLIVWHAMPIMLLSGYALIAHEGGFAVASWQVNVMQLIGLVMAAIFVALFFGPWRAYRRSIRPTPALLDRIRLMVTVNLALGAVVVLVASLGHFG